MPYRRYKNSSRRSPSTPCASRRGKRPAFRRQDGHWSGGPRWGMAPAASLNQGSHGPVESSNWAFPHDVGLVFVRRAAVGACGVGPHTVAQNPGRYPHGPCQKTAQQRLLHVGGGSPQRRAADRAIRPVAQPTEGDRAPRLQLARGVAARAVPDPVLELAERLLHAVQGVLLP